MLIQLFEAAALSSEDNPDSLLDDFVSAYFGEATLLQDVEYDNEDFGHYIKYYDESGVEVATSHKMIMGEGYELRINESGGDEGYGEKLIYEARSGGVESVERYFIENDDGTITETEVREQTFGTGEEAVTEKESSTFTYEVDDMGYPGEIISGTVSYFEDGTLVATQEWEDGIVVGEYDADGSVSSPIYLLDIENWDVPSLPEGTEQGIIDAQLELYVDQFIGSEAPIHLVYANEEKTELTGFDIVDGNIMLEMRGTFTTADPTQPPSAGLINSMVIVELIDGEIGAELASNRQLSVDWADFSHFVDFENVFTEDEYDQGDGSEDDFESEGHAHPEDIGIGVVAGWTFGDLAAWGAANEARIAEYGIVPDTWDDTMTATYSGFEFSQTISYLQGEFGFEVLVSLGMESR